MNDAESVSSSNHAEGLTARRRRHEAKELKTMRTVSRIVLSGLFVQAAHADEIRHLTFPDVMLGTWAETAEQCAAKDKSNVVIGPAKYGDGAGSCAVRWIVQTSDRAASITQCMPFAPAHRCRRRRKSSILSCGRLAKTARRRGDRSKIQRTISAVHNNGDKL